MAGETLFNICKCNSQFKKNFRRYFFEKLKKFEIWLKKLQSVISNLKTKNFKPQFIFWNFFSSIINFLKLLTPFPLKKYRQNFK